MFVHLCQEGKRRAILSYHGNWMKWCTVSVALCWVGQNVNLKQLILYTEICKDTISALLWGALISLWGFIQHLNLKLSVVGKRVYPRYRVYYLAVFLHQDSFQSEAGYHFTQQRADLCSSAGFQLFVPSELMWPSGVLCTRSETVVFAA